MAIRASDGGGRRLLAGLAAFVLLLAAYANLEALVPRERWGWFPPFRDGVYGLKTTHFGGEHGQIAQALLAGRGFADPFGPPTGPTAWMPPAYPLLIAGLRAALGSWTAAAWALWILALAVLAWTGLVVHDAGRRLGVRGAAGAAVAAYAILLAASFRVAFQWLHDSWLALLLMDLVYAGGIALWERDPAARPSRAAVVAWGALGGGAALAVPAVSLAWLALSAVLAARRREVRPWLAAAGLAAAGLAAACIAPWTARNAAVFGTFVPVKSNLFFDLHRANYAGIDGVLEQRHDAHHPHRDVRRDPRHPYRTLGEAAYLARYRAEFQDAYRRDPLRYWRLSARRALVATLWEVPYVAVGSPIFLAFVRAVHLAAALGLAVLLLARVRGPAVTIGLIAGTAYLVPYVLVTYYDRYGFALLPVKAVFAGGGAALVVRARGAGRESPG